jgi:dGTPase
LSSPTTPANPNPERTKRRFDASSNRSAGDHDPDVRTPTQKDRDRVLYSSAFRRLTGITQVASPTELSPVHNRLIHSLKVAQVGRSLALTLLADARNREAIALLGGIDADAVEAASLAHDLGHPTFGHVAEETLDDLLVGGGSAESVPDGYNGNAQTFRIVTKLAVRYSAKRGSDLAGLNLTHVTLNGILKYSWLRGTHGLPHHKWGAYDSESVDFAWSRSGAVSILDGKTIEAALMDWADDITYAVHDVEDFFRSGLIPLDRLTSDAREQERFLRWAAESGKIPPAQAEEVHRALLESFAVKPGVLDPFRGSRTDRAALRDLTSQLISRYVNGSLSLVVDGSSVRLAIDPELENEVRALKLLTWCYVIESPSLVTQRFGQRELISSLFRTFCEAGLSRDHRRIFPETSQEALQFAGDDVKDVKRIVADLIASMSEAQAIAINQRLTGQSLGSAMDAFLQ